jgi:hypothetical protein
LPGAVLTELDNVLGSPQFVADPVLALPATQTIDGATLLPYISSPVYQPDSRTITWSEVIAGSVAPQLVTASFSYFDNVDSTQFRWTIYAPGDATSLVIPDVPDEVTTHDLRPTDLVYPDTWLLATDGGTFDQLLNDVDLLRDDPAHSGFHPISRVLWSGGYGGGK